MRKSLYVFFILFSIFLYSCSENEESYASDSSIEETSSEETSEEPSNASSSSNYIKFDANGSSFSYEKEPGNFSLDGISKELINSFGYPADLQARVKIQEIADDLKVGDPNSLVGKSYIIHVMTKDHEMNEGLTFTVETTSKTEDANKFLAAQYTLAGKLEGSLADGTEISNGTIAITAPVGNKTEE